MPNSELGSEGTGGGFLLHQDVAEIIAASLPQQDLRNLREVSAAWCMLSQNAVHTLSPKGPLCEMLTKRFPFVSSICMSKHSLDGPEQLEYLKLFQRLATLNLNNQRKLRDNCLPFLLAAKGLTTISLRGCSRMTWAAVGALCELVHLKNLNCAGIKYAPEHAQSVSLPQLVEKLESLTIGDTCTLSFVDDSLLNLISKHGRKLESLDCSGCIDITDAGISSLSTLPQLKQLSVQSCVRLSNATAFNIGASLPNLASLNLRGCLQMTDDGVAALGPLTKLTYLSVQGCSALWGACFKSLSGCTSLEVLNASGCSNLLYLQHITGLVGLKQLGLSRCEKLAIGSLGWIGQLTGLTQLDLSGLRNLMPLTVPDESMNKSLEGWLSQLTMLQKLDLSGFVHPQGLPQGILRAVSRMTGLSELKLGGCYTPAWGTNPSASSATPDLSFLAPLCNLKRLDLAGWRLANPEHLSWLSGLTALQHLDISRFGNDFLRAQQEVVSGASECSSQATSAAASQPNSARSAASGIMSQESEFNHAVCVAMQRSAAGAAAATVQLEGVSMQDVWAAAGTSDVSQSGTQVCTQSEMPATQASLGSLLEHVAAFGLLSDTAASSSRTAPICTQTSVRSPETPAAQEACSAASAAAAPLSSALDVGLAHLQGLGQLREIILQGCALLTDTGVASLAVLTSLQTLDMGGCRKIKGASLATLCATCTHLSALCVEDCVGLEAVHLEQAMRNIPSMQRLELGGCASLTDVVCETIAGGRPCKLTTMSLRGCTRVTARGLGALASGLPVLRTLNLAHCWTLDDAAMGQVVAAAKQLSSMDVSHCYRVSNAAVERVRQSAPRLTLRTGRDHLPPAAPAAPAAPAPLPAPPAPVAVAAA